MARRLFAFGPFTLDTGRNALLRDGRTVEIGQRAFGLLHALLEANGRVVTKSELIDFAWPGTVVEESNLSVQIAALRKLLGVARDGADLIATVSRIGYRFTGTLAITEVEEDAALDSAVRKPSLAVLPFENLSGNSDQEYFADGIDLPGFFDQLISGKMALRRKGRADEKEPIQRRADGRNPARGRSYVGRRGRQEAQGQRADDLRLAQALRPDGAG